MMGKYIAGNYCYEFYHCVNLVAGQLTFTHVRRSVQLCATKAPYKESVPNGHVIFDRHFGTGRLLSRSPWAAQLIQGKAKLVGLACLGRITPAYGFVNLLGSVAGIRTLLNGLGLSHGIVEYSNIHNMQNAKDALSRAFAVRVNGDGPVMVANKDVIWTPLNDTVIRSWGLKAVKEAHFYCFADYRSENNKV